MIQRHQNLIFVNIYILRLKLNDYLFESRYSSEQINKIAIYLDSLLIDDKVVPYRTNSEDKRISGSCVLVNNDLKHRVLINKNTPSNNNIYDYSMFSCYFEDKDICDFEENK